MWSAHTLIQTEWYIWRLDERQTYLQDVNECVDCKDNKTSKCPETADECNFRILGYIVR